jgi:hypothetical protein
MLRVDKAAARPGIGELSSERRFTLAHLKLDRRHYLVALVMLAIYLWQLSHFGAAHRR